MKKNVYFLIVFLIIVTSSPFYSQVKRFGNLEFTIKESDQYQETRGNLIINFEGNPNRAILIIKQPSVDHKFLNNSFYDTETKTQPVLNNVYSINGKLINEYAKKNVVVSIMSGPENTLNRNKVYSANSTLNIKAKRPAYQMVTFIPDYKESYLILVTIHKDDLDLFNLYSNFIDSVVLKND